jgi:hypothetical protein
MDKNNSKTTTNQILEIMTIEEFEQLTIKQLQIQHIDYQSFILGIEKPQGQPEEYSVFLITDQFNNYMGIHITPLLAIKEAIEGSKITQEQIDNELAKYL